MKLTLAKFKANYYYKTDLIKLCRKYGLPTYGTKAELNHYILQYLSGIPKRDIHQIRKHNQRQHLTQADISLATPLVGSGFVFDDEARKFFANYFGVAKFSFKKKMAVIKRQAEAENDLTMTVGDLIREYQRNDDLVNQTKEEKTYQWNNFVKDFCADPASQQFPNKMKVAAILWGRVKRSMGPKEYHHQLLSEYVSDNRS
ncbi:SAP domain-containing protein [Lentilactobacillus sp. IMAU92037]|uniref:SAP domain-containing protein n=1 Tax=Lentilactobacillus TaxID=2767893 RepID=UPI001C2BDF5D|nr:MULTISPECIES: SAP domain-containing protein [Lentilactobacillus]MBV0929547.1 SAP domain-containing protein [Lentilactobacillus dabitei]MDM7515117.1 SAP domain-containing protein [Lentilactobacillus sp. TOM.63]